MTYFYAATDRGGILTTSILLDKIGEYVKTNPGCITDQYDPKDVSQRKLSTFEAHCQNPSAWYEEAGLLEYDNGTCTRIFFVHDTNGLYSKYGYHDDDDVTCYVETDGFTILSFNIECHC